MIPAILLGRLRAPIAPPDPEPTPLAAGTATATAGDGQVALSATAPTGGSGSYTYQWHQSAGGVRGAAIPGATTRSYTVTGLTNGVARSYILRVSDGTSSVDYPEVTATPSATTWEFFHDFNNGLLGPYVPTADVDVVDDPTGSGRGKVARLRYNLTAGPGGGSADRAIGRSPLGWGFGQTRFFRGEFYLPNPSFDNRKLLRFDVAGTSSQSYLVVNIWGSDLKVEGYYNGEPTPEWWGGTIATLPGDVWHTLEVQITTNSAPGVPDGILRVWANGMLRYEKTTGRWLNTGDTINMLRVGEQLSIGANLSHDEYRYWDNVGVSTTRMGG